MYLKRLETVGFKSFADRVGIDFVPGVTAVVGPNGSGKSNITDAIRWVLGEQSVRSLRGSKMEDIIFQGSDSRNALNVAEVTLILDNSAQSLPLDYDEVSVTRRVYRSGASEFYINKQACRLKDIVDLFMDSGLGRHAFTIISQGKVEEILSSKEEDRRIIFEEAAGVLKYKQRKEKAEFKLAETEENLFRVDDIIYEIEQQIDPLREQAKTAKKYIEKRDQLKEHEISLLVTEIEHLHFKWETLLKQIEEAKSIGLDQRTEINKINAKIEVTRNTIQNLDEAIDNLQEKLLLTTQKLEQYEGQKNLANERSKHFIENKHNLEKDQKHILNTIKTLSRQYTEHKEKLDKLLEERQRVANNIKALKQKLSFEVEKIEEQIEDLKSEYIEYLNEQAAKRNEMQTTKSQLEQLHGKKEKEEEKQISFKTRQKEVKNQFKIISDKTILLEENYNKSKAQIEKLSHLIKQKNDHIVSSEQKLNKGFQMIARLNSRKEVLQEMKEEFQGFFHGVRSVLKASEGKELTDIYGAVVQLLKVPDEYVDAIETVLGGQAQHIVVKDEQSARKAINWLKKTNNGRATFLPLTSIEARFITNNLLEKVYNHPGFIDVASNLVTVDERFKKVVDHLMGNVVIAKTLKDANELAVILNRRYRIITLEGDVVYPGGSMSGGAKRKTNQSLFTREKELEATTEKLEEFQKRAEKFKKEIKQDQSALRKLHTSMEALQNEADEFYNKLQEEKTNYERIKLQVTSINEQMEMFEMDQRQTLEDERELITREETLIKDLNKIKNHLANIQQKINELTERKQTFEKNREQITTKVHQLEITLAEIDERLKNQQNQTKMTNESLMAAKTSYESCTNELKELIKAQQSEATIEELANLIQEIDEEKASLMNEIQEKRSDRLQRMKSLEDDEREVKEKTKVYEQFMQQIQEKEVKSNRLDVELENRLSQLQTDYAISYERAKQKYVKTEDPEATRKIVDQLKQAIKGLGRVNLGAIDEFERISERYTFLTEQKEDLEQAKQSLFEIIAEMDEEMKIRFEETFTQIKEEFSVVFKELFGGGRAELNLTDPNNLLDTGIEIIAQPPGKKLQQLGLLSGGERALTAISLLFAILRVRPVPFCVLDEVEAALDEANVLRFAKYVKMHSADTQFIVITHRKGTMEEADVLYGVTMQESGVSRLVSVRLEETDELVEV